jgi:hypothetical protein
VAGASESVSLDRLLAAFNAATRVNGIDKGGIRIPIPGTGLRLRFMPLLFSGDVGNLTPLSLLRFHGQVDIRTWQQR